LETTLTSQDDIRDEIKGRLNSGNACHYSVRYIPSFRLTSKKLNYTKLYFLSVSYGYETWSLTLRKENRLRLSEDTVLRRMFESKREEDKSCRKLHNDELHSLHYSPNFVKVIKSRRMRWAGHVARMGEGRNVYRILVGRPEGKKPLRRPKRKWEDNIKMDLREIGIDGVNWIRLAQDWIRWRAFVDIVMKLRVPAPWSK
jgi:hypothetical protein